MQKFLKNHVFSLIAWVLILIISIVALPNITELTNAHSDITLPSNVESNVAQSIENNWGAKKKNTYAIALVFNKEHGKLTDAERLTSLLMIKASTELRTRCFLIPILLLERSFNQKTVRLG